MARSYELHKQGHLLGARILLRCGFETLATLIYLNQLIHRVMNGRMNFHVFCDKTNRLLAGSRNGTTKHKSINIVTVLEKCEKSYPGLVKFYADLSESAHPNFEGLCFGYSKVDHNEYETNFSNRWCELYGERHLDVMELCMESFHVEYNDVWPDLIGKFENWVEVNNTILEATKNDPLPI